MVLQKYESVISEINHDIEKFNTLLAEEFRIAPLNISNSEACYVIADIPWKDQVWPSNQALPGVYVLCARQQSDPSRLGVYIGKSSLRNIGSRFYFHLYPHSTTNNYQMNDRSGETFIIEAIVAIGFPDTRMRALATALEEFIIAGVRTRVHLLNCTGNTSDED